MHVGNMVFIMTAARITVECSLALPYRWYIKARLQVTIGGNRSRHLALERWLQEEESLYLQPTLSCSPPPPSAVSQEGGNTTRTQRCGFTFSLYLECFIQYLINVHYVENFAGLLSVSAASPRGRIEQRTTWPTETGTMVRILKRSHQVSSQFFMGFNGLVNPFRSNLRPAYYLCILPTKTNPIGGLN